jgi:hypothetical protein
MNGTATKLDFKEYWKNWRKDEKTAFQQIANPNPPIELVDEETLARESEYNEKYNEKIKLFAEAEKYNEKGNTAARQGDYIHAIEMYKMALKVPIEDTFTDNTILIDEYKKCRIKNLGNLAHCQI